MALTKVSTDGVKDDAITSGKIPANAVGASELADNAVDTNAIANNAVTAGKTSGVQTTINNNADNRVITGSGTANTLNGESNVVINAGKLGIGLTSPVAPIHTHTGNATNYRAFSNTACGGSTGSDGFLLGIDSNANVNIWNFENTFMNFATNGGERLRIDAGGNLLLGTTTEGLGTYGDDFTIGRSTHSGMTIRSGSGYKGNIYFSDGTSGDAEYRGGVQYDHSDDSLRLSASAANRVRIDSDGLKFGSDTAAANGLDDYEEGTFTPRLGPHNNHSIYENGTGKYTKIGNSITYTMSWDDKDCTAFTTNSRIEIWNLPFTFQQSNSQEHQVMPALMMHNVQFANNEKHYFYTIQNGNNMYGLKSRDGNSWIEWGTADWNQDDLYFDATGSFFVN